MRKVLLGGRNDRRLYNGGSPVLHGEKILLRPLLRHGVIALEVAGYLGVADKSTAPEADIVYLLGDLAQLATGAPVERIYLDTAVAVKGAVDKVNVAGQRPLHAALHHDPCRQRFKAAVLHTQVTQEPESAGEAAVGDGGSRRTGRAVGNHKPGLYVVQRLAVLQRHRGGAVRIVDNAAHRSGSAEGTVSKVVDIHHITDTVAGRDAAPLKPKFIVDGGKDVVIGNFRDIPQRIADIENIVVQHADIALIPVDGQTVVLAVVAVPPRDHMYLTPVFRIRQHIHIFEVHFGVIALYRHDEGRCLPDGDILKYQRTAASADVDRLAVGMPDAGIGQEHEIPAHTVGRGCIRDLDLPLPGTLHRAKEPVRTPLHTLVIPDSKPVDGSEIIGGEVRLAVNREGNGLSVHRLHAPHQVHRLRHIEHAVLQPDIFTPSQSKEGQSRLHAEDGALSVQRNPRSILHGKGTAEHCGGVGRGTDIVGLPCLKAKRRLPLNSGTNRLADRRTVIGHAIAHDTEIGCQQYIGGFGPRFARCVSRLGCQKLLCFTVRRRNGFGHGFAGNRLTVLRLRKLPDRLIGTGGTAGGRFLSAPTAAGDQHGCHAKPYRKRTQGAQNVSFPHDRILLYGTQGNTARRVAKAVAALCPHKFRHIFTKPLRAG